MITSGHLADTKAPGITVAPSVESISDTEVLVSWETDEYASSEVICQLVGDLSKLQSALQGIRTAHSSYLTGLEAGASYECFIQSVDIKGLKVKSDAFSVTADGISPSVPVTPKPELELKVGHTSFYIIGLLFILNLFRFYATIVTRRKED